MTEQAKSYIQMRNEFYEKFKEKVSPKFKQYEFQRKCELRKKALLYIPNLLLVVIILAWYLYSSPEGEFIQNLTFYTITVLIILPFYLYRKEFLKLTRNLQEKTIREVCNILGNVSYKSSYDTVGESTVINFLLPEQQAGYSVKRTFEGVYKNVRYTMKSIAANATGKGSYFRGIVITFQMNKKFNSKTVLLTDSFCKQYMGTLKRITFEDVWFENKFDVYTDDEVEARYIITPSFMENLSHLKTRFGAKEIRVTFADGKITVSILDKKKYSTSKYDFTDESVYLGIYDKIISVIKIIDDLELNKELVL